MADDRRDDRRRDDDRRDDDRRDEDRERRRKCWPHFGNLHERIEVIRRIPQDDAREFLRTIILAAFFEGENCGREEQCECSEKLARALCCCHHRRREDDDWGDDDERGRSGERRR